MDYTSHPTVDALRHPGLRQRNPTTDQLKEAATRYGLPLTRVNKLTIKSLQQIVSVGAAVAC